MHKQVLTIYSGLNEPIASWQSDPNICSYSCHGQQFDWVLPRVCISAVCETAAVYNQYQVSLQSSCCKFESHVHFISSNYTTTSCVQGNGLEGRMRLVKNQTIVFKSINKYIHGSWFMIHFYILGFKSRQMVTIKYMCKCI